MTSSMSRPEKEQFLLSATIMGLGMHLAAWMAREGSAEDYVDVGMYQQIARTAEEGKLHAVFLADTLTNAEEGIERPALGALDPAILLMSMAAVTDHLGLVGTASTTFNEPFDLARRFATLDHLSGGRAGWNAVTTFVPAVADNFGGRALPDRDQRYDRADEFVRVVLDLWGSWKEGALVGDKRSGTFADPELVHAIDHVGSHFSVRGPLTLPRTPQGRPALFQAGSSSAGRDLAARYADVVFTAQNLPDPAREFRNDVRARAAAHGRNPNRIKIMPGLLPILGGTEQEARERKAMLDELAGTGPELTKLARRVGIPVDLLELDKPLPVDQLCPDAVFTGSVGFRRAAVRLAVEENLTVRELLVRNGGGHLQIVGTPEQVADTMEEWVRAGAADGFNLMIDIVPSGLDDVVKMLVPELQEREVFHKDYEHVQLRKSLGVSDD